MRSRSCGDYNHVGARPRARSWVGARGGLSKMVMPAPGLGTKGTKGTKGPKHPLIHCHITVLFEDLFLSRPHHLLSSNYACAKIPILYKTQNDIHNTATVRLSMLSGLRLEHYLSQVLSKINIWLHPLTTLHHELIISSRHVVLIKEHFLELPGQ